MDGVGEMNELLEDIILSRHDAKPISQSMTYNFLLMGAIGWTIQNIANWLMLDQSGIETLTVAVYGLLTFIGALLGIMRRSGIRVPSWMIEAIEAVLSRQQK